MTSGAFGGVLCVCACCVLAVGALDAVVLIMRASLVCALCVVFRALCGRVSDTPADFHFLFSPESTRVYSPAPARVFLSVGSDRCFEIMAATNKVKIVAIGDGTVGKTSLLISYSKGEFPDDYVPTVFENYRTHINTSAGLIALDIWDTAGQEEYDEIRKLAFNQVDVFLVCFSIDSPASLQNLESKWIKDVAQSESPKAQASCCVVLFFLDLVSEFRAGTLLTVMHFIKVIICGTKNDLRFDDEVVERLAASGAKPVTSEQGEAVANRVKNTVNIAGYAECSALTGTGLKEIFTLVRWDYAVMSAMAFANGVHFV